MTALVLLDHDRVRVAGSAERVVSRALSPLPPAGAADAEVRRWCDEARDAVADALPARDRARIVLVIGLGLTEIAMPSLPPVSPALRRAMVERDADRYFPIDGEAAVALKDGIAFGIEAARLRTLRESMEGIAGVRAIVSVASLLAQHAGAGGTRAQCWLVDGGPGERGIIEIAESTLREARRAPANDSPAEEAHAARGRVLDDEAILALRPTAAAIAGGDGSVMLLDAGTRRLFTARRRRRWYASATGLVAASVALAFAVDQRQERALQAAMDRRELATRHSAAARTARDRLLVVARERAITSEISARPSLATTLDLLGALLPADAFVERLEWDGSQWRIDGSAASAARLVPILDASPSVDGVRLIAASTRFVDRGRQRESFSIAFAVRHASAAVAPSALDVVREPGEASGAR